ncbi:DUF1543 domain-containing protein [Oryzifoliimicrobium ureilyticus]|uniref:DUF1543 domain-containing protein n=1 Tax=Oryzifoliimicrobium ureilyticus TaxID=3113724 RepID=UPI00307645B9
MEEETLKLYMFYVGGDCGNSNIELHDVRFSIGQTAEDCRDDLRRQWWGDPKSLHLDCWGEVEQADGYDVIVGSNTSMPDNQEKLFFLNLGGYDRSEFGELHKNVLLVAPDAKSATKKALQQVRSWTLPHKDNVFEVEKAIDLSALTMNYGRRLQLMPALREKPFQFTCAYIRIGTET